jgi:hypothetical protein
MSWRKASVSAWVVVALRASSVFPKCVLGYDKHWRGVCCQIDTPDVHAGGMAGQGGLGQPGEAAGGTQLARGHPGGGRCQMGCAGLARSAGYDLPLPSEVLLERSQIWDLESVVVVGMAKWTFSTKWPTQAL